MSANESVMEVFLKDYANALEGKISDSSADESRNVQKQNVSPGRVEKRRNFDIIDKADVFVSKLHNFRER